MAPEESHVYHHNDLSPRVNLKAERNSRGYNYEATVTGAQTVAVAMELLNEAMSALKTTYGTEEKVEK